MNNLNGKHNFPVANMDDFPNFRLISGQIRTQMGASLFLKKCLVEVTKFIM